MLRIYFKMLSSEIISWRCDAMRCSRIRNARNFSSNMKLNSKIICIRGRIDWIWINERARAHFKGIYIQDPTKPLNCEYFNIKYSLIISWRYLLQRKSSFEYVFQLFIQSQKKITFRFVVHRITLVIKEVVKKLFSSSVGRFSFI